MSEPRKLHLQDRTQWYTDGCWPAWQWDAAPRLAARVDWSMLKHRWLASIYNCGHRVDAPEPYDRLHDALDWCEQEVAAALLRRAAMAGKRGAK